MVQLLLIQGLLFNIVGWDNIDIVHINDYYIRYSYCEWLFEGIRTVWYLFIWYHTLGFCPLSKCASFADRQYPCTGSLFLIKLES